MKSIRSKIILMIVTAIILSLSIATIISIDSVIKVGREGSNQILLLLCETGEKNLDSYFDDIEHSVEMVSSFAVSDLEGLDLKNLPEHIDRVNGMFEKVADKTEGILTYYYRIDPELSTDEKGFWFVDVNGEGFQEHEVTDITAYDTSDTSKLVWFTVPKYTKKPVWLPPYVTDNLGARVLSYNVPIYKDSTFIGVIGIELDYSVMAEQVDNIRLYDNGYAFINDSEGTIIYHPMIDVTQLTPENTPKVPEGLLGNGQFVKYTFDGVEKQAVFLVLKNGMRLNVTVPVSEINGNWVSLVYRILIISVVLLLVFIIISTKLSGRITKPLRELTGAAEQVYEGNYDVELPNLGNDEVGVLAFTFNRLVKNLKTYIEELNQLNSKLKEDNLTLEAATVRDSLTGVKNRFALRRDYDNYANQDIHVMMIDIDDFKGINDNFGHSIGDFMLKNMGDALSDIFGVNHSYRYGGDEFVVIIPDISEDEFQRHLIDLGERLENISLEDRKLPVHFSAGYVYGKVILGDDLRYMLRQADEFLYRSKGMGKNMFSGKEYNRDLAERIKKRPEEAIRKG